MKILAAGDIHGDLSLVRRLVTKAKDENVDMVILCGDITNNDEPDGLIGPFKAIGKRVLLIPGNHESFATGEFLEEQYDVLNMHNKHYEVGDIGFFGCGGANVGLFQLSENEIFKYLKDSNDKFSNNIKKKLMITHVHPSETKMERFSNFIKGSDGVTKAIKLIKPDLVLCSHVHEAEGIEEIIGSSKIINVGRNGKIIEL